MMSRRSDSSGVEAVREQLRSLGYLRGPISGWISGRSFLGLRAAASLKAGLLAGPVMGLAVMVAVALSHRPFLASPRDLLLVGLYLSMFFGAILAVLELAVDMGLGWLARRGFVLIGSTERLAARVGFLFTMGTILYLAYLLRGGWAAARDTAVDQGGLDWLLWGAAVVGALAAGHIVGRVTRLGSLITLLTAGAGRAVPPGRAPSRKPFAVATALLLLIAAALVLVPAEAPEPSPRPAADVTPVPFDGRVVLLAVDGLDASWYERARELGTCPALHRLETEGARYDLESGESRVPPVVWTTMATGRPGDEHGIQGYQSQKVPGLRTPLQESPDPGGLEFSVKLLLPPLRGARSPVSSVMRRARAVWEILDSGGVRTASINFWATWPVSPVDSIVVSERALGRFAAGAGPDRDVSPAIVQDELKRSFLRDMREVRAGLRAAGLSGADETVGAAATIDAYHALLARRFLADEPIRVLLVYLPGLDIARSMGDAGRDDGHSLEIVGLTRHLDMLVDGFSEMMGPDDILLVVGHPGRAAASPHPSRPKGLLLAHGGRVLPVKGDEPVTLLDLTPTLLALAGFPPARDLAGHPILGFLAPADRAHGRLPPVETYGDRDEPHPVPPEDDFDDEALERLRSLGYIK